MRNIYFKDAQGNEIDCPCGSSSKDCMAFTVPANDSYLGQSCVNPGDINNIGFNATCNTSSISTQTCMEFTRSSATFPDFKCTISNL